MALNPLFDPQGQVCGFQAGPGAYGLDGRLLGYRQGDALFATDRKRVGAVQGQTLLLAAPGPGRPRAGVVRSLWHRGGRR